MAAVGPGAALAAAKPDGSVANYQSPEEFVAAGMQTQCPITLVDAGPLSDQIITQLADRKDITTIVTGVGPAAGSTIRVCRSFTGSARRCPAGLPLRAPAAKES